MERAIDEIFDFKGVMLKVEDIGKSVNCNGCYFDESGRNCLDAYNAVYIGYCNGKYRIDGKNVIFVEVEYDQIRRISNE